MQHRHAEAAVNCGGIISRPNCGRSNQDAAPALLRAWVAPCATRLRANENKGSSRSTLRETPAIWSRSASASTETDRRNSRARRCGAALTGWARGARTTPPARRSRTARQPPLAAPSRTRCNDRQVFWLAGRRLRPPSRIAPVALGFRLTAYSCGAQLRNFTAFLLILKMRNRCCDHYTAYARRKAARSIRVRRDHALTTRSRGLS